MRTEEGQIDASDTASTYVGQIRTFRVNPDNTTTPLVQPTRRSTKYGVVFSWFILASVWDSDGGPPLIALKTSEVNAICGHEHVQGFRTEQDQDASGQLYNYAVITVGTDDLAVTDEARVRMDQIGLPSAFGTVDATWQRLVAAGAS